MPVSDAALAGQVFAKVPLADCADVADVSERACEKFGWGAPTQCRLYLVREGRERARTIERDPSSAADILAGVSLSSFAALAEAGIVSGSCLLARVPAAPSAAAAGGGGALPPRVFLDELRAIVRAELRASAGDDAATAETPAAYESRARRTLVSELERRCGLRVLTGASPHRLQGDILDASSRSVEWDFRAPVTLFDALPSHSTASDEFVIYPSHGAYVRPPRPSAPRILTPTRVTGGATAAPPCDFLAIFEATTKERWSAELLPRLEERLLVSLDRARSNATGDIAGILDVVAVIGVVSPYSCQRSIAPRLPTYRLLSEMAAAGRFVFVEMELSPSESGA